MVTQPSSIDRTTADYPEALLIGGRVQDKPDAAKAASPITYVSADDPPFLTAHGTKDQLVPYDQALELDAAMKKAGAPHLLIEMTGAGHGNFRNLEINARVRTFLDKHLRGVRGEISTQPIATGK
jgi:dipeptidyl aminopeptidase/acylaminoacyl peptidase